ncbi:sigma 54-interacting transcriptional regulator [Proteiniborus sp. MB09-C3]|uniref:sigma-54-dependent Fis family transcriptional regulator n=1 Tax=Proteiniborus sp. MB09-C3 TaxID=3050072 RepID=UPI002557B712|nr:sigma 54-interacting transcriptional regulator [Proteiniborus sp. MB09-C3]WIV12570.1 sigma 54-interacting transcriptional regulator [Proteiniborus sp. MB09-C3]
MTVSAGNIKKEYIMSSHERSKKSGIRKDQRISNRIICEEELQARLLKNRELILISEPFINQLHSILKGASFFTILTDAEGCILSVIGHEEILSEAFDLKMTPGAFMDESNIGTNAMSVALHEKKPVQVTGEEHYIAAYHRWTCSASPIMDNNGKVIGSLDLTGYTDFVHPHTLGMVVAAVKAIEKIFEIEEYSHKLMISKNYIETIIDSMPMGIITSDLDGNIKGVNKHAVEMFGYGYDEMKRMIISELFKGWPTLKNIIHSKKSFTDEEVFVNAKTNKLQFNLSAYPVLDHNEEIVDIIYVFSEVKKVRRLANKIMGRQAIYTFDKIIGNNEKFKNVMEFAKKVADSKSTILITGESGTGKEVLAQSIHNYSNRREEAFVAINCGAIPRNLIESELFGYEEGAFTGAKRSGHPGKFEIADGGTIFLDEIAEMPLDMQTRLLRVIEEGTVSRIGGTNEIIVDVRIIAASNKDLQNEVLKGNFRKDLFYRLNVLPVKLPPLRERREDIPLLIDYFMKRISRRLNKKEVYISDEQMIVLKKHDWYGNVRELENFVELIINTECVSIPFKENSPHKKELSYEENDYEEGNQEEMTLEHAEKQQIIKALKKCSGNITLTAKTLGIGRNTLYRKLEKHNIDCSNIEQCSI